MQIIPNIHHHYLGRVAYLNIIVHLFKRILNLQKNTINEDTEQESRVPQGLSSGHYFLNNKFLHAF